MKLSQTLWFVMLLALCCASARGADDITAQEEAAFKAAAAAVAPSVVRIETFGGSEQVGGVLVGSAPTTGLVVSEDGFLLSSAFNFAQKPNSILVTLPSGKRAAAQIVARDHSRMLVLLKVATDEKLTVPSALLRTDLQVGQWAIAVGRTYDGALPNISVGVVSAKDRIWGKAIQADAKVSPSNYGGPLIDLQGRVLGILVPMSPQGQGDVAGAEWYDSGIGFAIPLDEMLPRLVKMKRGEDLHPGLIGISIKDGDINADPAIIMACQPKGPAASAGLKPQDKVVRIDNLPIERHAQLKHALGGKYAGDTVRVTVERDGQQVEKTLELIDKLAPYQHPLLGILPLRDKSDLPGVRVRYVFPASPASEAGLARGDRITALADVEVTDAGSLAAALAAHEPGKPVTVKYHRGNEQKSAEVMLAALNATIPEQLPAAQGELPDGQGRAEVGIVTVKLPEEKNECFAYIPTSYRADLPAALLVALHTPGKFDREELLAQYKAMCDEHRVILLMPRSAEAARWETADATFIKKAVDDVAGHYAIDRQRIAVTGYQAAGTMAWLTAMSQPETFRAVIAVESPLPGRLNLPPNEPAKRTWFYLAHSEKSPQKAALAATAKRLEEAKYPLVQRDTGAKVRDLSPADVSDLGRWLDALDRL